MVHTSATSSMVQFRLTNWRSKQNGDSVSIKSRGNRDGARRNCCAHAQLLRLQIASPSATVPDRNPHLCQLMPIETRDVPLAAQFTQRSASVCGYTSLAEPRAVASRANWRADCLLCASIRCGDAPPFRCIDAGVDVFVPR